MKLGALIKGIRIAEKVHWDPNRVIHKITSDSRSLSSGDVFVACQGSVMDGHDFLGEAILAKASVLVYETTPEIKLPKHVVGLRVRDTRACLSELLNNFYQHPDEQVNLVGITGTNGKTTTGFLLHRLLSEKAKAAYLGTLWYDFLGEKTTALNTTPASEILLPILHELRSQKNPYCVMEVSSHALEQKRVHGLTFDLAIFTQLSRDHLDYHRDMEAYFEAKCSLFTSQKRPRKMLINKDCPFGQRLLKKFPKAKSFSLREKADYQVVDIQPSFQGSHFKLRFNKREVLFHIRLPLIHNVANAVTVLAALDMMGYDPEEFKTALEEVPGIPGRVEPVLGTGDFKVFVDYAHTPDAVEHVLAEAKKLNPRRILTLMGCGGDRDRAKRPLMARVGWNYSDLVILTSDNPRSEDPEFIISDMKSGIPLEAIAENKVLEILDRREAIKKLISLAQPGDVLFVLGKGHEDYQIIGSRKIPFDDREVVQECLQGKKRVTFS